jgi:hypothetical protein
MIDNPKEDQKLVEENEKAAQDFDNFVYGVKVFVGVVLVLAGTYVMVMLLAGRGR